MEKLMRDNLAVKILCVALAVILWLYVSYEENPSMTKTVKNVPIAIVGEQALKENNLAVYSVSAKSVNVSVTAKRLTLARLTNKTLSAVINVSAIKNSGKQTVPATVSATVSASASYTLKGKDISVVIEPISTKTYKVKPEIADSANSSIILHSYSLSSKEVKVSAPKSIHEDIGYVTTQKIVPKDINITEATNVPLIVLGKNGKKLEGAECSPAEIDVKYDFYEVRSVPVILRAKDGKQYKLSSGYDMTIYGYGEEFGEISQIKTEKIDLSKHAADSVIKAKLILPKGVMILNGAQDVSIKLDEDFFSEESELITTD